MNRLYYDLHLHSCLSPCGDADMTPNNIAGMGVVNGLSIMALTDHNTAKNCPAFFQAAKRQNIVPVAGMELTTAEDIHVVCLFRTLEAAMEFDAYVDAHRFRIPNRTDIFGEQLILNEEDEVVGIEPDYLTNATDIPVEGAVSLVSSYGGICYPAHIDRESNGIIAILGTFPDDCGFTAAELKDESRRQEYVNAYPVLRDKRMVISSDAHVLWDIQEKKTYIETETNRTDVQQVRNDLFAFFGA